MQGPTEAVEVRWTTAVYAFLSTTHCRIAAHCVLLPKSFNEHIKLRCIRLAWLRKAVPKPTTNSR